MVQKIRNLNYRGLLCVLGAFLIHFTLGSVYTFGNMSPYISSYLIFTDNNATTGMMVWIFGISIAMQGITMPFGGLVCKRLGSKMTILIGCWVMSLGTILTYFTIDHGIYMVTLTYGVIFGMGTGLAYSVAIASAIVWFPEKKGLVIGIVVGGFGFGSFVFNQIQTGFINPHNIKPNLTIGPEIYFDDPEMLERVPWCFVLIGGIYAVVQLIGVLLLFQPRITEIQLSRESSFTRSESIVISIQESTGKETTNIVEVCDTSLSPLQAIKTRDFWLLCITFLMNGTANIFVTSLYKTFAQTFIKDDLFLATVGSIGSIFNAGSRVLWGMINDRWNYRWSMRIMTIICGVFMSTFYLASYITNEAGEKAFITIWFSMMLLTVCGTFAMLPSATTVAFGTKHVATIYGMVFMSNALAGIVGSLITSILKSEIGYLGVFEVGTGFIFISFLLTFFYKHPNL